MAMTPAQQAEYNSLMGKRNTYNQQVSHWQGEIDRYKKELQQDPTSSQRQQNLKASEQALKDLQARGEGYEGWERERIAALESGNAASRSPLEAAMQGVPELPKLQFSEMIRRRQVGTPEYNAQKAAMALGEQRAQQAAQRQLLAAQAKSGVRGGAAAAQQQRMAEQGALQRAAAEQALVAKSQGEREKLSKQQQFGDLSSQLARMQMASAELGQQRGLQAAADTAAAQRAAAAGAGGCCGAIAVTSTVLLGANETYAAELVWASKTPGYVVEMTHPNAVQFVSEIKAARKIRDEWCSDREKRGYYRLSEAFVPAIKGNKFASKAVYITFVKPVVSCANGTAGFISQFAVKAWFKLFDFIGGDKPFTRSNGEVV